ncbi:fluoride efflux transporter CrcB [Bacillus horti]|nr:fluoride efflux transporter CrcB [Bacillus horti]
MNGIALAIGAFFGTITRYGIGVWMEPVSSGFPYATLLVNLSGCLFLGWFFTLALAGSKISVAVQTGIGVGFTGSFTTFSTFSLETISLIEQNQLGLAVVYVLLSTGGGVLLAAVGYGIAKLQVKNRKRKREAI